MLSYLTNSSYGWTRLYNFPLKIEYKIHNHNHNIEKYIHTQSSKDQKKNFQNHQYRRRLLTSGLYYKEGGGLTISPIIEIPPPPLPPPFTSIYGRRPLGRGWSWGWLLLTGGLLFGGGGDKDKVEDEPMSDFGQPPVIPLKDLKEDDIYVSPLGKVLFVTRCILRLIQIMTYFLPIVAFLPLSLISIGFRSYWWRGLRFILKQLGGCWIKIGQWASTRPDIFSKELVEFISEICHNCPSHSLKQTKQIIQTNYGKNIYELFSDFPEKPIASGAIAQVYLAKLKNGRKVAVKVQHPGVAHLIDMDLFLLKNLVKIFELIPGVKWLSLKDSVAEFSQTLKAQTDLRIEGRNLMVFNMNFSNDKQVIFPKLIEEFIPTRSVLVETYEEGEHLMKYLTSVTNETKAIANIGLNAYLKMMLIDNFVHADLHPGNILVRKIKNNQFAVVFLDVGLIFSASPAEWLHFKQLYKAIVEKNGKYGASLMVKFAKEHNLSAEEEVHFEDEMGKLFNTIRELKLSEIDVGNFLSEVLYLVRKYRVKIEGNFATLCVGTTVMEGVGKQLDPDLNILDASIPVLLSSELLPDTTQSKIQLLTEYLQNKWNRWRKQQQ